MKRFFGFFLVAAVAAALAGPSLVSAQSDVEAYNTPSFYQQHLGQAVSEQMKWFASGAIPGSNVFVDTTTAGTLNDTTYAYNIGGAVQVAVTLLSRSKNDDSDFTVYAQVSHTDSVAGPWHTLNTSFSVDNTAGAQVGGTEDTGRDTTLWLLLNNTMPDSVFTAQTGMTAATHGDMAYVRSARYLRLWIDPDHAAGTDTTYHEAIVTRIYPR